MDKLYTQEEVDKLIALVREDERERIAILEQDNANCRKAVSDLMDELQNHSEQDLNMVQEPVAWECHCQGKTVRAVKVEAHRAANKRDYENWKWAAEQSAAYSARQMRDAAVKVCRDKEKEFSGDAWEASFFVIAANAIAALPILGEEK